jgi:hypothetical protein
MVNYMFNELSFQARLTSEWACHTNTLFALRSLCCIDLGAVQKAERAMNDRPDRRDRPEVLKLALVEDVGADGPHLARQRDDNGIGVDINRDELRIGKAGHDGPSSPSARL